jgi:hypothetical protein
MRFVACLFAFNGPGYILWAVLISKWTYGRSVVFLEGTWWWGCFVKIKKIDYPISFKIIRNCVGAVKRALIC